MSFIPQLKSRLNSIKTHSIPSNLSIHLPSNPIQHFSTHEINLIKHSKHRVNLNQPKKNERKYPIRKQFIFENYIHLFTQNKVNLFFKHEDLTTKEWNSIRGEFLKSSFNHSNQNQNQHQNQHQTLKRNSNLKLQFMRTKMILPVLKSLTHQSKLNPILIKRFSTKLNGNLICLSQTEFDPFKLHSALKILTKFGSIPTQVQINQISIQKSNQSLKKIDRLPFVLGIIEDQVEVEKSRIEELSRLPTLDILRQQILALIGTSASRLVGTLDQARGKVIVRTVDGYRATLEKQENEHPGT
ncbi:hypothetical protein DFH28DRAFT_967209 [Melampsora americana]|nr:hypothetical protein DFH28DRAFT_967209 [Melampsora americana]